MSTSFELVEEKAEDRYYKEHERKENINTSLSVPIGIVVALMGVIGFFLMNIPFKIINIPIAWGIFGLFVVGVAAAICCLAVAIRFMSKIFLGLTYAYMPNPQRIRNYAEKLEKYYKALQAQNIDEVVEKEVRGFLVDAYCKSTDINIKRNEEKGFYLTEAKKYIILALVFLMVISIPFVVLHYREKNLSEDVQKVEIVEEK